MALTYDGATMRLYINGTQVASRATAGAIQTTTSPLWIGGNSPYGEYFQGLIDEARVYNRALTQAEHPERHERAGSSWLLISLEGIVRRARSRRWRSLPRSSSP